MGLRYSAAIIVMFCSVMRVIASEAAVAPSPQPPASSFLYHWQLNEVGNSAQLITLFCSGCATTGPATNGVPLVSVLRDTLGDKTPGNDRVTYVWLLSLTRQNIGQRFLAGVPFFYWRVGEGSTRVDEAHLPKPLMDLTKPEQPMTVQVMRDVLQWTVLDPLSMPVRATSRAYRTNEVARERAHLEGAIEYLRAAPKSDSGEGLTQSEADTVIARLALRENLLGGLVGERQAERLGERQVAGEETVRTRNWDLLRTFADKSGLLFEPLDIAGSSGQYALLWFPADSGYAEPVNSSHAAVWKALNLRDPWTDNRLREWEGPVFQRSVNQNGTLLPAGMTGERQIKLIPIGAYSLTYPKFPLLVIDFRDKLHVRRNEMTQRTINELTSGIIGISHFTNWYYYAGANLYDFVASRHGRGMDAAQRLDSYSQFRTALVLDNGMDPKLKTLLQQRIDSVAINPLEGSPEHEIQVATAQYVALLNAASSGELAGRLDRTREAELVEFGTTPQVRASRAFVRTASFGLISPRYKEDPDLIPELNRTRRVQADLDYLHNAANAGPNPEVAYEAGRLRAAVQDLSELLPAVRSKNVKRDAQQTLTRLSEETKDAELQADCSFGLLALSNGTGSGVAASPKVVETAMRVSEIHK